MPLPSQLPVDFNKSAANASLVVNRYSMVRKIGSGNFGTAFLVLDTEATEEAEKQKVLKQICVGPLDPGETVDAMHEARLLSQLQHHNIVQFHESFVDGQFFCILLEYCEGGDLECKIRDCKKQNEIISEDQVTKWLRQLLDAIKYMHDKRILHRDLKSRNIFLKDNEVKVGDFGISRILIGASDKASTFVGTPYYMSPEVLKHEQYDEKCDVWSLGCVLYEICCFEHAFDGTTLMAVMFKIVSEHTPQLPQQYSRGLNNVLERMLGRDVNKRPTAEVILQHPIFQRYQANSPVHLKARERRLQKRKQKEADARARKLKELSREKLIENERIRRESKERNFSRSSFDSNMQLREVEHDEHGDQLPTIPDDELHGTVVYQPLDDTIQNPAQVFHHSGDDNVSNSSPSERGLGSTNELLESLLRDGDIPEEEDLADTYYSMNEDFESFSSSDELPDDKVNLSDSEYRDMVGFMEDALYLEDSTISHRIHRDNRYTEQEQHPDLQSSMKIDPVLPRVNIKSLTLSHQPNSNRPDLSPRPMTSVPRSERPLTKFNESMVEQRITKIRHKCLEALGEEVFLKAYDVIKDVRFDDPSLIKQNEKRMQELSKIIPDGTKCMQLEELIYVEQQREAG